MNCALICALYSECKAFAFDTNGGVSCMFLPTALPVAGFVASNTTGIYWNELSCVDCLMCTEGVVSSTTTSTSTLSGHTTTSSLPPFPTSTCALTNGVGCTALMLVPANVSYSEHGSLSLELSWSIDAELYPYQNNGAQCAAICYQISGCEASAYDALTNACQFIDTSLSAAGFEVNSTSAAVWSDMGCYSCPNCAPSSIIYTSTIPSQGSSSTSVSGSILYSGSIIYTSTSSSQVPSSTTFSPSIIYTSTISIISSTSSEYGGYSTPSSNNSIVPNTSSSSHTAPGLYTTTGGVPGTSTALISTSSTTSSAPSVSSTGACTTATAQLSDDVTCGIPGMAGNQAQSAALRNYVIKPAGSLEACALICLQNAGCLGFGYDTSSTVCYPFTVGTAGLGLTYVATGTERYYDSGCYSC